MFDEKPPDLHVNPCGALIKQRKGEPGVKIRIIVDLLRSLLNENLDDSNTMESKNPSVCEAVESFTVGSFLFVIDLSDCFFHWLVKEEDQSLLGFYDPIRKKYGRYRFLPFGLSKSPGFNCASVTELTRLLYKRKNVKLSTFVDDSLGGDSSCEGAWTKFESAVEFFLDCGVAVSIKSSGLVPPSQETVWTGWMIHTVRQMIIAEEKVFVIFFIIITGVGRNLH